jgi:hypothetical protein
MLSWPERLSHGAERPVADTVTAIERRVNREADVLVVIDDPASYSLVVTGCRCVW